jgi:hypothetical protein
MKAWAGRAVRGPGLALALGVVVVAVVSLPVAFFGMFSGFQEYDDEGYVLLSLRQYAGGGALYDQVFSQYGPAYYQVVRGFFAALGLPYTHTTGRGVVMGLWLAIGAVCAVATFRLTRSVVVALATQLLVVDALVPLRNEPLHPGGLLALLVSAVALAGSFLGGSAPAGVPVLLGALLAVAVLTKVNVGGFLIAAVGCVILAHAPAGPRTRVVRAAAVLGLPAVPLVLMLPRATEDWVRDLMLVVAGAALAVGLVLQAQAEPWRGAWRALGLVGGAAAVTGALVCVTELLRGTSPAGLLRGIVLDPLALARVAPLPYPTASGAVRWGLLSLLGALLWVAARRGAWRPPSAFAACRGPVQLLAGVFLWLVDLLGETLPLLWLALVTPGTGAPGPALGRSLLVATAVLQALHAYPVAGSQVAWATFLLIPVGGVLIVDGWRASAPLRSHLGTSPVARRAVAAGLGVALLAGAAASLAETGGRLRRVYHAGVPLGLPGGEPIRVWSGQAERYQALVGTLRARCRSFVAVPGFTSLYLFSDLAPPTMRNVTMWTTLLTDAEQAEVVERLRATADPVCALRKSGPERDREDTRATRYVDREFGPLFSIGDWVFMVRRPPRGEPGPA